MSIRVSLVVGIFLCSVSTNSFAQLVHSQTREDYRQPTTYSPEDPNFRSRLFLEHTGHSGRFYNCDGEEDKRFSPYIYWTTQCNKEHIRTWSNVIRCDIREVSQRVQSGSCRNADEGGCNCSACQAKTRSSILISGGGIAKANYKQASAANSKTKLR